MREGKGMIKILIVEDEISISKLMEMSLKRSGYQCDCAYDGEEAVEKISRNIYDLILLDVMLPKIDGFELMEYIRPMEIPVIFITAKDSVNDRVKGLRMGAEDYIVKPFEIIELLARVDVVLRRFRLTDETMDICGLHIDLRSMQVTRNGREIPLTKKEYDLLLLFTNTVSHKMVMNASQEAKRNNIPIVRIHRSSTAALQSVLEDIKGGQTNVG